LSLALIVVILAIATYFRISSFTQQTFGGRNESSLLETTPANASPGAASSVNASSIIGKIQRGERFSLLILGYGGPGHDGPYLSDTILQLVYDPAKKAVTMINVPRDLYAYIPYGPDNKGYWGKINEAFSLVMSLKAPTSGLNKRYYFTAGDDNSRIDAAVILAKDVVEQVTGIPVNYWMTVNFDGFIKLIDAIGGIDVVVDKAFTDNSYPTVGEDGQLHPLSLEVGPHHMAGKLAIAFARSRYSNEDNGDFARSKRQMKVIQAVKEKALKPDIIFKASSTLDALQGNFRTSLAFDETLSLANFLNSDQGRPYASNLYFLSEMIEYNFLNAGNDPEEGFIFTPKAGKGNYGPIRDWLKQALLNPQVRGEALHVQVQNATGVAKNGPEATQLLQGQGFDTTPPATLAPQPLSQIIDYSQGKGVETIKQLQGNFPGAEVKSADPPSKNYDGPDVVVILGANYLASGS
jgi:LCP family protein required for cell wall assembly